MQADPARPDSQKCAKKSGKCATTSTSNGVINLNVDEEWLAYEKLTEVIFYRPEADLLLPPRASQWRKVTPKSVSLFQQQPGARLIKRKSNTSKGSVKPAEIVFDKHGDGDKAAEDVPLPIRKSLFPNVSPYISFSNHDRPLLKRLPADFIHLLKWKFTTSMPRVLIKILMNTGYQIVNKGNDWSAIWNLSIKDSGRYLRMKSYQKVNSMPGSQNIGDKDSLWNHLYKMMRKFGSKEYGFMPRTYVLPREIQKFESMWCKHGVGTTWIIKPPSSGRGQGIKIVNQWWEIPKWHSVIIQRYITRPKLINGLKFDLRIYVLLTSINPMRIYIYKEGLVRFASVRYVRGANLSDKYMHLTNSSVNKQNPDYVINDGVNTFKGHKWSFASLWTYLGEEGVDVTELWSQIKDIVAKALIAGESDMNAVISENLVSNYTCYELYGFDILLDEVLRPWLLEVNILPSLQTNSPLDMAIKGPMVKNVLNMVGYQVPRNQQILGSGALCKKYDGIAHDYRLYSTALTLQEKTKQNEINAVKSRESYLNRILQNLTRDDLRHLVQYEDEFDQAGDFDKIFPTKDTYSYFKYFEVERYYDRLLDAWENRYSDNREEGIQLLQLHCEKMLHLEQPLVD